MHLPASKNWVNAASILLLLVCENTLASTITSVPSAVPTCEFRTINYITDTLPQRCLRSTWSHSNGTTSTRSDVGGVQTDAGSTTTTSESSSSVVGHNGEQEATTTPTVVAEQNASSSFSASSQVPDASDQPQAEPESEELDDAAFLSFDEWRKQTLAKAGQDNANIGGKKPKDGRRKDAEGIQNHLDSLGDEGEIDLDFGAFKTDKDGNWERARSEGDAEDTREEASHEVGEKKDKGQYRSKDAGKTCKERYSYASFDAGATVLKTHPGAKNPKAILIENKDSYMLSECKTKNKFVIIELSEDIWIDTLVLANYEFFSSMTRTFRVSVSDRYPVKMEKWKDIGTYEARNSREIQAFLIENPQIWARYLRIEFLTHYGKEYYCPLSLVRVHGTRMLESWKESEANNDDEEDDEGEDSERSNSDSDSAFVPEAVADVVAEEERLKAELKEAQAAIENLVREAQEISATFTEMPVNVSQLTELNTSLEQAVEEQMFTPWVPDFDFGAWMNVSQGLDVCLLKESPSQSSLTSATITHTVTSTTGPCADPTSTPDALVPSSTGPITTTFNASSSTTAVSANTSIESSPPTSSPSQETKSASQSAEVIVTTPTPPTVSTTKSISSAAKLHNSTNSIKSKMSSSSSASAALPTQQESFFKAVSRRLQLLEANSTLSLKYIEEQSRALRDAFSKVEKRQLNKTTTFLDALNSTVLNELKEIRQQYDEIWQSTVISLESQREENKKEILAISSRLSILADEVVFQKRMSIIQSVLLLLCLGLVIFSRMSPTSSFEFANRSRFSNSFPLESPITSAPGSPEYEGVDLEDSQQEWASSSYYREQSEEFNGTLGSEVEGEEYDEQDFQEEFPETPVSPPTPTSMYSRESSYASTPPLRAETSTPDYFYRSSPLKRSVSMQHSSNQTQSPSSNGQNGHNGHPSIPARLSSVKDGNDIDLPRSRARAKSDPRHNPGINGQEASPSPVRTPRKRKSVRRQQFSPQSDDRPLTPTRNGHSGVDPQFHSLDMPNPTDFAPAGGQIPTINTTPASPPQTNGGGGRNRHTSSGSFSIARKPLPALPPDTKDDE